MVNIDSFSYNGHTVQVVSKENKKIMKILGVEITPLDMFAFALTKTTYEEASEVLNLAVDKLRMPKDKSFDLMHSLTHQKVLNLKEINEFTYQKRFKQKVSELIEGGKLISKKNHPKHQPDAWIEKNNTEFPVEVKLNEFDLKALDQLQRYMNFYKCTNGVAIGRELTVKLPSNIRFISLNELE